MATTDSGLTDALCNICTTQNVADTTEKELVQAEKDYDRHLDNINAIVIECVKYMVPIGLLVNAIFLYVVGRIKSMRSIVNVYLGNLAVADSLFLIFQIISATWTRASGVRFVLLHSLGNSANLSSYFIVTALAIERFSAVHHPLAFRMVASKSRAAKIVAVLWVLAATLGIGVTVTIHWGGKIGATISNVLVIFIYTAGLFINASLYACIVKKLRRQPEKITLTDQHQKLRRVIAMIVVNTAVFFILNIVFIIEVTMALKIRWSSLSALHEIKARHSLLYVELVGTIVFLLSSSVDPLVYSGVNADYRAALVEAFSCLDPISCCCCWCCHHRFSCSKRRRNPQQEPEEQIELQEIHGTPNQDGHSLAAVASAVILDASDQSGLQDGHHKPALQTCSLADVAVVGIVDETEQIKLQEIHSGQTHEKRCLAAVAAVAADGIHVDATEQIELQDTHHSPTQQTRSLANVAAVGIVDETCC